MKLLLPLVFLFSVLSLNAQEVILLEKDSAFQVFENLDISDEWLSIPIYLFFKNNTNDSILVNWRREFGDNCPVEWRIFTADELGAYIHEVVESIDPIPLTPSDSNFQLRQMFYPKKVPGCCDVKVIFSLEGSPNNPIDTGYFHIEVNANGCVTSVLNKEL